MSNYTKNLRSIATNLRTEGWELRAAAIDHAAQRMESMEELITNLLNGENIVKESKQRKRNKS